MKNNDEKEKFNKYIEENYDRMLAHIKNACFFQSFQWSLDYYHDAIISIYDTIDRNEDYKIDYKKIDQLLFITYKYIAIHTDNSYNQRYILDGDMLNYANTLYDEFDIDEYYEPEYIKKIIDSVYDYFGEKHKEVFTNFLQGGKLKYRSGEERQLFEDIKLFVKFKFNPPKDSNEHYRHWVTIRQYDLNHKLVKTWHSIKEICDAIGINRSTLNNALRNKKPRYGYYWRNGRRNKKV